MSTVESTLAIHELVNPIELDAAAELITGHMMFDPVRRAQRDPNRRPKPIEEPSPSDDDIAYQKETVASLDELQFGAFDDGQMIAVAGIARKHNLESGGSGQIVDVVTRYGHRRQGIGRILMQTIEDFAVQRELNELFVAGATGSGGYFYESIGYAWDNDTRTFRKSLVGSDLA